MSRSFSLNGSGLLIKCNSSAWKQRVSQTERHDVSPLYTFLPIVSFTLSRRSNHLILSGILWRIYLSPYVSPMKLWRMRDMSLRTDSVQFVHINVRFYHFSVSYTDCIFSWNRENIDGHKKVLPKTVHIWIFFITFDPSIAKRERWQTYRKVFWHFRH